MSLATLIKFVVIVILGSLMMVVGTVGIQKTGARTDAQVESNTVPMSGMIDESSKPRIRKLKETTLYVLEDPETGCQYIINDGDVTARMNSDGTQKCKD